MYEAHFNLREKPFALGPDPAFLYPSRQHRLALDMLEYACLNQAGFAVLTGEIGSGKTTLVRALLERLGPEVTVGLVDNTHRSLGKLLQWICAAYEIDSRGMDDAGLHQAIVEFLVREYAKGQRVLLVVDEAQNLDVSMLEALRILSNVNANKHFVLQTILVGQPELRETLCAPGLRQFAQRISVDHHLPVLAMRDARQYVMHRLQVAGGRADLIVPEAADLACAQSGGVPRLINQLCDTALVYAYADQQPNVSLALMTQVVSDRTANGLFPGVSRPLSGAAAG